MIIKTNQNVIERSSTVGAGKGFSIAASSKAFRALASNLYQDKHAAVVRELLSNAFDSHIEAGKRDVAVLIHLPNINEPTFSIRDFGTGISREFMLNRYTVLFDSSKADSNDAVGCFGVGRMSILSIVDSFMVTSWYNGTRSDYAVFYDEQDQPSITLMGEEPCGSETGFEVSAPAKSEDFRTFEQKLESFLARVSNPVTITGCPAREWQKIPYGHSTDSWKIRVTNGTSTGAKAVMGQVAYDLRIDEKQLTLGQKTILKGPVDIFFAIGDINVALSRESLSLDQHTLKTVKGRLDDIETEIQTIFRAQLKDARNLWHALQIYTGFSKGEYKHLASLIPASIKWKDHYLKESYIFRLGELYQQGYAVDVEQYFLGTKGIKKAGTSEVGFSLDTIVVFNDLPTGAITRGRRLCRETGKRIVLITTSAPESLVAQKLGMDGDSLMKASEIPKPVRAKGGYVGTMTDKGKAAVLELTADLEYTFGGRSQGAEVWELVNEDFDWKDGGVYIPIRNYKSDDYAHHHLYRLISNIKQAGCDLGDITLFGIKRKGLKFIQGNDKWITLKDYLKQKSIEYLNRPNITQVLDRLNEYEMVTEDESLVSFLENLPHSGTELDNLHSRFKQLKKEAKTGTSIEHYKTLAHAFSIELPVPEKRGEFKQNIHDSLKGYPMLEMMVAYFAEHQIANSLKENGDIVKEYIQERKKLKA